MGLKYLLIGGCGFIGSHLARKLVALGRSVKVLDRVIPLEQNKITGAAYIAGDYCDAELIDQLVSTHDEIIHLAYATRPNTSFDDPMADLVLNLSPAVQLFETVARCDKRLLLISSGGTVYGEAISTPISENHPTHPISPYGVTKLTLEKYAHFYAVTKGLQVVCIRPSNPYGEGQLPFVGQGFVSTAIATALRGEAITIFGKKGSIRDYIYVGDLADGILTILDKGKMDEVYNIGSGVGLSNLQVVEAIRPLLKTAGVDVHVQDAPERHFDVKTNILNSKKLRKLGWAPGTAIDTGLKRAFEWLRIYLGRNPR